MLRFPRQTGAPSSTSSTITPAGPSSNSTSVSAAQTNTSVSVSSTSTPPSVTLTSLPPSVPVSPPTSLPPSSTTSDPPTRPPPSDTSVSNTPIPDPSPLSESSSHTLSFSTSPSLENITTIVTSINGQVTTFTSQLPTSLVGATPNNSGSSSRTAVIAGATAGVIVLLCLALTIVFSYRRHRLRKVLALTNQKKEGKGLLDGEEFDDDDVGVPMRWHADQQYSAMTTTGRAGSPAPSLIRSRVSETGSIFREEVWPPPGFVDPIKQGSSQVNLGHIVDDVMGPTPSRSVSRLGEQDPFASTSDDSHHSHLRGATEASAASTSALLPRSAPPTPSASSSNDPFTSSNDAPSVYYPSTLPPGASPPSIPGQTSYPPSAARRPAGPIPHITETPPTPGPGPGSFQQQQQKHHQHSNSNGGQPKKSSPLSRPLSGDASIWLGRSPHPS